MRHLTANEIAAVSGAETNNHSVIVFDPVAAIQGLFWVAKYGDQDTFIKGSLMGGMAAGALACGAAGFESAGLAGAVAYGFAGMFVGGFVVQAAAVVVVGAYNILSY